MMTRPVCETCGMRHVCRDSSASWIFFLIGIIATISLRIIEPLRNISPSYAKISWYVGVTGFLLFFIYKYRILKQKSEVIRETGLKDKLFASSKLTTEDYTLLSEIVCSQDNWKERANFMVIFALSGLALLVALWFELA
ncbi:MAG: hypothetical protein V1921_01175 [Candidatus Altiarchaeota archaeon]